MTAHNGRPGSVAACAAACVTHELHLHVQVLKGQRLKSGLGLNVAFLNGDVSASNQVW